MQHFVYHARLYYSMAPGCLMWLPAGLSFFLGTGCFMFVPVIKVVHLYCVVLRSSKKTGVIPSRTKFRPTLSGDGPDRNPIQASRSELESLPRGRVAPRNR